jgi:hypothetical protein
MRDNSFDLIALSTHHVCCTQILRVILVILSDSITKEPFITVLQNGTT